MPVQNRQRWWQLMIVLAKQDQSWLLLWSPMELCSNLFSRENLLWEVQLDDSLELLHRQDFPTASKPQCCFGLTVSAQWGTHQWPVFLPEHSTGRAKMFSDLHHSLSLFLCNLLFCPVSFCNSDQSPNSFSAYPFFFSLSFTGVITNKSFTLGGLFPIRPKLMHSLPPNPNTTKLFPRNNKNNNNKTCHLNVGGGSTETT